MEMLPLQSLAERHPGLTEAIGACYAEAASVCLSRHHDSPAQLRIDGLNRRTDCEAEWDAPDSRTTAAWANEIDATENGAYGVSLASMEISEGLVAIHRAETRTGADYYVAPLNTSLDDLENCLRLEVSGTDHGAEKEIRTRLKLKITQAKNGVSNLPAVASVVAFRELRVVFEKVG